MNAFEVYLFFVADSINIFLGITCFMLTVTCIGLIIATIVFFLGSKNHGCRADEDDRSNAKSIYEIFVKWTKLATVIFSVILVFTIFMPDKKTLTAMYIVPKITNNKDIQKMPTYIAKYINSVLLEKTKENSGDKS